MSSLADNLDVAGNVERHCQDKDISKCYLSEFIPPEEQSST